MSANGPTTEKIIKHAEAAVREHHRNCPGVRSAEKAERSASHAEAVVTRLERSFDNHAKAMEAVKDAFRDGDVRFVRLETSMEDHDSRIQHNEVFREEIQKGLRSLAIKIIVSLLLAGTVAAGAGEGITAIISALGG
jgi:hypothetical protein